MERFRTPEAAKRLGCSVWTIRRLCKEGKLDHYLLASGRYAFEESMIESYMLQASRAGTAIAGLRKPIEDIPPEFIAEINRLRAARNP